MATKANLVIDQGSTYSTVLTLTDEFGDSLLLNGMVANSQMRKSYTSSNATTFSTSIDTQTGTITLSLSAAQTGALVAGRYVYDVVIKNNSDVRTRVLEGIVNILPQVTVF